MSFMTLEDLRVFATVCDLKSMSEAARRVGRTQAAIAQHIRKLERELDSKLFVRNPRGVSLTASGRTLYEGVSVALARLETTLREVQLVEERESDRLSLAVSAMAATGFLRTTILRLNQKRPELEVHFEVANTAEGRLAAVRQRKADLAFVPMVGGVDGFDGVNGVGVVDGIEGFETRPAMETELQLLVHCEHKLASRKRVRARELSSLNYISPGPSSATHRLVGRVLLRDGIQLQSHSIVEDPALAIMMVELGRGETFIPALQAYTVERTGLAKAITVQGLPPLAMVWAALDFDAIPEAARQFLAVFEERIKRMKPPRIRTDKGE